MAGMESLYNKVGRMEPAAKVAILLVSLAVVGISYFFGAYRGVKDQRDQLESSLSREKKNLREAKKQYRIFVKVKRQAEALKATNKRLARSLPDVGEIPLGEIHKRADAAGVQLTSIERQEEEEHLGYARIPIQMSLKGQYHRVMEFFWKLGKMDRIVKVSNIKMEHPKLVEGQVILEISCQAATYRYLARRTHKKKK